MRIVKIEVPIDSEAHLYLVGDEHTGTKYHATKEFARVIQTIKDDPVARFIGMGDKCDFITPSDPRWDGGSVAEWVHPDNIAFDQSKYYCDMVAPIADKCDGLIEGNHEDSIKKHSHVNVQKNICEALGVRDLSAMAWIRYILQRSKTSHVIVDAVVTHGSGTAITRGAKLTRLERLMNNFNGDIFGHGHVHDIIIHPGLPYLDLPRDMKLKQKRKVAAMTGCYFRTYTQDVESSYGEKKNYPSTMIGSPMFTIKVTPLGAVEVTVSA